MESYAILLIVSVMSLTLLLGWIVWLWAKSQQRQNEASQRFSTEMSLTLGVLVGQHTEQLKAHTTLSDKAIALLVSKDPMTFQQIQLMNQAGVYDDTEPFDPSEEAEMERIKARDQGLDEREDLNGLEQSVLDDLGPDADFFRPYEAPE